MGFFDISQEMLLANKTRTKRAAPPTGCKACGLDGSGKLSGFAGKGADRVLILSDYPRRGEGNDAAHVFSLELYDVLFDQAGCRGVPKRILDHAWVGYALPCPVPEGKEPKNPACCSERLDRLIRELQPRVIIPMGVIPTKALIWDRLAGRIKNTQPSDLFGKRIPDRKYNAWICPTYSPEFISWQRRDSCPAMYLAQHVRNAWALKDKPLPEIPDDIRVTEDPDVAAEWIEDVMYWAAVNALGAAPDGVVDVAIDYETTGLKPHREGHRIYAASVAYRMDGKYHAFGFLWDGNHPRLVKAWHELTHHPRIGIVAHNASFEACWTRFRGGIGNGRTDWPTNWSWDTCLAAHVIDNNQKVGLKLHTYCELGVLGYDTKADKYIRTLVQGEAEKYGCNAFNLLHSGEGIPRGDVVYYCSEDSLYTLFIRDAQVRQLSGMEGAFRFFMEGMDTLARVQSEGLPIDLEKARQLKEELRVKLGAAVAKIMASPDVKKWQQKHPGEDFNPNSNKQLCEVLYDVCKLKPPAESQDVKEDTLTKLGTQLCRDVLEMRHWAKIRDTFLESYQREAVWDEEKGCHLIRTFFNLSTGSESGTTTGEKSQAGPRTYRSSADSPNFQNIPKRDKQVKKMLRNLFVAPPGFRYMEMDYKSLEVMVSASYHHDPQMIHYLQNPESDMHRDTACDMYIRTPDILTKEERSSIKSGYVFASFYGANYKSCATRMWANMPPYTKEHLAKDCGINTFKKWEAHVEKADDIFWNQRFKVYNQWRKKEWDRYQTFGYVESYTGFRCRGPMGYTEATNRCIQGSAFHILLRALSWDVQRINELAKERGMQSCIIGQIHDAIIALVREGEENQVAAIVYQNGVERVSRAFPWICVPLVIEAEMSPVGATWADMKDVGELGPNGIVKPDWPEVFKAS
jgi:DNA polymerase I-like protein with 3'-5' exonuclease and polymerase domains